MLTYEDAIIYKVGDVVTINFTPTGKSYEGREYHTAYKNLKCKIIAVEIDDVSRPLRFDSLNPDVDLSSRSYLPIEGVTIVDEFDMPEIEPGMWAKDRNGDNWLAVKTSKNASKIEWIKAPMNVHETSQYFLDNLVDLHDTAAVYWDRNKQSQLKELQQKQQELTKQLEALNQQIQAMK